MNVEIKEIYVYLLSNKVNERLEILDIEEFVSHDLPQSNDIYYHFIINYNKSLLSARLWTPMARLTTIVPRKYHFTHKIERPSIKLKLTHLIYRLMEHIT